MTHDSLKLVMLCCFAEREWGTSPALSVKDFHWPTEDVGLDLWWRFFTFRCPAWKIPVFLYLSGNLLMVFDRFEGVLNKWCCPKWVGAGHIGVVSPSPLVICGQAGIQFVVIMSSQPVFCGSPLFLSSALISSSVSVSQSASCLMLPLIQFLLSYLPHLPPTKFAYSPCDVKWIEKRLDLNFVCNLWLRVCLSSKQFHKMLFVFIKFSC